jgi:hypothetical protein
MRIVPASLVFVASLSAIAAGDDLYHERPGGAEVYYAGTTTVVSVAGVEHDLDSSRVMLDYAESANDWLYLGLAIGLSFDQMSTEPLIGATDPVGYALGAFAGARFLERGPFALLAEARYQRIYTEGSDGTSDSILKYSESGGRLGAAFRWEKIELQAGGYTLRIAGDIESTGAAAGVASFEEVEQSGVFGAARLAIDGGYALGLRVESGARETVAFTFSTRF